METIDVPDISLDWSGVGLVSLKQIHWRGPYTIVDVQFRQDVPIYKVIFNWNHHYSFCGKYSQGMPGTHTDDACWQMLLMMLIMMQLSVVADDESSSARYPVVATLGHGFRKWLGNNACRIRLGKATWKTSSLRTDDRTHTGEEYGTLGVGILLVACDMNMIWVEMIGSQQLCATNPTHKTTG